MLNSDIMSLTILTAVSILAVMIAVNAQGRVRLSLSWFLASIILAGDAAVIFSYLKSTGAVTAEADYSQRLADEKNSIAQKLEVSAVGREDLGAQDLKSDEALKVQEITSAGIQIAERLSVLNLDDYTVSEEQRASNAAAVKRQVQELKARYDLLKPNLSFFRERTVEQAIDKLDKAALYCRLYYTSENSDQEGERERVMRTASVSAKELFVSADKRLEKMK